MTGVNKAELRRLCEAAPQGDFELQTGCSWRRIGMKGDGDILRPVIHQHDGWPDLSAADCMLEFIVGCTPAKVKALLDDCDKAEDERDAALAELEACRKDAERYRLLRQAHWWGSPLCVVRDPKRQVKPGTDCPSGERLDEAVDAFKSQESPDA